MRRLIRWAAPLVLVTALAALAGCSDESDDPPVDGAAQDDGDGGDGAGDGGDGGGTDAGGSDDRQSYVDAIASEITADGDLTEEQAACMAEAVVDSVGIETLVEIGSAAELGEGASSGGLSDLGVELTDEQKHDIFLGTDECVDLRGVFLASIAEEGAPQPFLDCVDQQLSDDLIEQIFIGGLVGGEAGLDADAALNQAIEEISTACAAQVPG
jgi:hypothetical protein